MGTHAVLVFVELVDHGLEFIIAQVFAKLSGNATEVLDVDFA